MGTNGIYAVVFGNYEPAEVAALYDNEAAAQAHVDDEIPGEPWRVVFWAVQSNYKPASEETT